MKAVVIIPTYNERENIVALIDDILNLGFDMQIIVVDDDSPDGTTEVVKSLAERYKQIHLIHRKSERGRGRAGVAGFKHALMLDVDCILEMDADFSHDPAHIPVLIETLKNYDIAIGSRFVKGARDFRKGVFRHIVSRLSSAYLRLVLGVRVEDCTSGYRAFRRHVLESIGLDSFISVGPSIVGEVLYKCKGFKIKEIPIKFIERRRGKTKLNFAKLVNCLIVPWKTRIQNKR